MAGALELLHRYQSGTPAAKAVLEAALDARRRGVARHFPKAFLTDVALDYLSGIGFPAAHGGERVLAALTPGHLPATVLGELLVQVQVAAQPNAARVPGRVLCCSPSHRSASSC
ncbi:hypothetical protein [Streptomyces sp. NPDC086787]|uniref:hypothetical protein n=1 Tax=Streptomyces sp. NPDC086787 TaxID=3365759 RepID=UPI00380638D7